MPRVPPELNFMQQGNEEDPLVYLSQAKNIAEIDSLGCGEWTIIYEHRNTEKGGRCSYSALMSRQKAHDALKQQSWDISIGSGMPGFIRTHDGDHEVTTYNRFSRYGIEPLIYCRSFGGIKPKQYDLNEEFRLFHNLYHDRHNDRYIHVDDRGGEMVAAEIGEGRARVLTHLLRQYLAARQLALALFFDHRAKSELAIAEVRCQLSPRVMTTEDRCYAFSIGEVGNGVLSRLIGKKIILPPPESECGIWPYDTEEDVQNVEFIIGVDEHGKPIAT